LEPEAVPGILKGMWVGFYLTAAHGCKARMNLYQVACATATSSAVPFWRPRRSTTGQP